MMLQSRILHRRYAIVVVASMLCFASQLAGILLAPPNEHYEWDPLEYATLARNLYQHGQYGINRGDLTNAPNWAGENPSRTRQPLYPLFLIVSYWIPGKSLRALQVSQLLLNLGTLWCALAIARRILGRNLWAGTAIALGLYFPLWFTSAFIMSESLFTFLLALSMLLLQRSIENGRRKMWSVALAGGLLGLCCLTRPVGFAVCICGLLLLLFCHGAKKGELYGLLMLGACAIVLFPWALRNYLSMGEFTPLSSEGGANLLWGVFRPSSQDSKDFGPIIVDTVRRYGYYQSERASARFRQIALERIRSRPMAYLGRRVASVAQMWGYFPGSRASPISSREPLFVGLTAAHYLILVFAGVGLSIVGSRWGAFLLLPAISITLPFLFLGEGLSRYLLPAAPYLLILAGEGAASASHKGVEWVRGNLRPFSSWATGTSKESAVSQDSVRR